MSSKKIFWEAVAGVSEISVITLGPKIHPKLLADVVFSFPLVGSGTNCYLEDDVSFNEKSWLDADGSVPANYDTFDLVSCVKLANDLVRRFEARTSDVNYSSSQHVSALRSIHQFQICTVLKQTDCRIGTRSSLI
jgi:hypothetical protein